MNGFGVAPGARRAVTAWLYTVAALIFVMVVLGGFTRLTESGLSMVDWRPIMGAVPPLNEAAWQKVFDAYQQFPEYRLHNTHMTLHEFKFIFYMEFSHRLLGRLIGMVFFFPFAFFLVRRVLSGRWIRRFAVLFVLGGLQGVVGWYMVKSGLVDIPRVSHYRLVSHLSLAVTVFTLSLWYAFEIGAVAHLGARRALAPLRGKLTLLMWLLGIQIVSGGFVAGLRAGIAWYTWWIPQGVLAGDGFLARVFDNPITVMFFHRNFAVLVAVLLLTAVVRYRGLCADGRVRRAWHLLAVLVVVQVSLGVSLVLWKVPVLPAGTHQGVGLLLWAVLVYLCRNAVSAATAGDAAAATPGPRGQAA